MVNGTCMCTHNFHNEMHVSTRRLAFSILARSTGCTTAAKPHSPSSERRRLGQPLSESRLRSGPRSRARVHVSHGTPKCSPQTTPLMTQPRRSRATAGRVRSHAGPHAISHAMTREPSARSARESSPHPEKTSTKSGPRENQRRRQPRARRSACRGVQAGSPVPRGPPSEREGAAAAAARLRVPP